MKTRAQTRIEYGIYDTTGNCWLGDSRGPKRFDDFELACVAAQVFEMQVYGDDTGGKYWARPFPAGAIARFKDEVKLKRSALSALQRIEGAEE